MKQKLSKILCVCFLVGCGHSYGVGVKAKSSTAIESSNNIKVESLTAIELINPGKLESDLVFPSNIKTIDKVLAFVNRGVITSNQLDNEIKMMRANYKQKGITVPDTPEFRNNVLNQLITLRVELDLAKRMGIQTSDIDVTTAVNNIAKSQNLTLNQFKTRLAQSGVSYDAFRKQAFEQITAEKLKQREVDARVMITDDEINRVLSSETFKKRVDYDLSYIIISVPEQASLSLVSEKKKIADTAYQALKSGQSFNDVSAKYSNAPNALSGGALGWKSNIVLPLIISNALSGLTKGQFTKVVQLPVGFLIFRVNSMKTPETPQQVVQYDVRHILIKVNENNSDDEAHQKIIMIKAMLDKYKNNKAKESGDFAKLAKQYSEDASSISGGDIGWVNKGDTVPEFEAVMLKLPVGQISEPVRTPFGWHIMQVDGVRKLDKTNEVMRASIRQEIRDLKATLLYAEWIRNIRDAAYVKINDN